MNPSPFTPWHRRLMVLFAASALAACASEPPVTPILSAGAASVESARAAGASEFAASEFNEARNKLDRARTLAQAGRTSEARRLAEQADVDAQLARARAGSERSRRALDELDNSLRSLREELNRNMESKKPSITPPSVQPKP